jgi:hypothetical protein
MYDTDINYPRTHTTEEALDRKLRATKASNPELADRFGIDSKRVAITLDMPDEGLVAVIYSMVITSDRDGWPQFVHMMNANGSYPAFPREEA